MGVDLVDYMHASKLGRGGDYQALTSLEPGRVDETTQRLPSPTSTNANISGTSCQRPKQSRISSFVPLRLTDKNPSFKSFSWSLEDYVLAYAMNPAKRQTQNANLFSQTPFVAQLKTNSSDFLQSFLLNLRLSQPFFFSGSARGWRGS